MAIPTCSAAESFFTAGSVVPAHEPLQSSAHQEINGENRNEEADKQYRKRARDGGTKHPVYRGVRMRGWGRRVSEIRQPRQNSRIWLGTYATAEMAARAYDAAASCIKGGSAILNFPQLRESLPRPASLLARDVQAAAAAAKAAAMEELRRFGSYSCEANAGFEGLGEIIELPSLEGSYGSSETGRDVLVVDAEEEGWLHPPWWASEKDFSGCFFDESAGGDGSSVAPCRLGL